MEVEPWPAPARLTPLIVACMRQLGRVFAGRRRRDRRRRLIRRRRLRSRTSRRFRGSIADPAPPTRQSRPRRRAPLGNRSAADAERRRAALYQKGDLAGRRRAGQARRRPAATPRARMDRPEIGAATRRSPAGGVRARRIPIGRPRSWIRAIQEAALYNDHASPRESRRVFRRRSAAHAGRQAGSGEDRSRPPVPMRPRRLVRGLWRDERFRRLDRARRARANSAPCWPAPTTGSAPNGCSMPETSRRRCARRHWPAPMNRRSRSFGRARSPGRCAGAGV